MTLPLILLAMPSLVIGWFTIGPVLFGDYFGGAIFVCRSSTMCSAHMARGIPRPAVVLVCTA